jgi:hypothetical protein
MNLVINSQIEGEFTGFNDGAIFSLTNGQVWQQKRYKYMYKYAYRPKVKIYREGSKYLMQVNLSGCEPIEVAQVQVNQKGRIVSEFKGFHTGAKFEFDNGTTWEQVEYKYNYYYFYLPTAIIVSGIRGTELSVQGMSESVLVRRVR